MFFCALGSLLIIYGISYRFNVYRITGIKRCILRNKPMATQIILNTRGRRCSAGISHVFFPPFSFAFQASCRHLHARAACKCLSNQLPNIAKLIFPSVGFHYEKLGHLYIPIRKSPVHMVDILGYIQ